MGLITDKKILFIDARRGTHIETYDTVYELIVGRLYPFATAECETVELGIAKLEELRDRYIPDAIAELKRDFEIKD